MQHNALHSLSTIAGARPYFFVGGGANSLIPGVRASVVTRAIQQWFGGYAPVGSKAKPLFRGSEAKPPEAERNLKTS